LAEAVGLRPPMQPCADFVPKFIERPQVVILHPG